MIICQSIEKRIKRYIATAGRYPRLNPYQRPCAPISFSKAIHYAIGKEIANRVKPIMIEAIRCIWTAFIVPLILDMHANRMIHRLIAWSVSLNSSIISASLKYSKAILSEKVKISMVISKPRELPSRIETLEIALASLRSPAPIALPIADVAPKLIARGSWNVKYYKLWAMTMQQRARTLSWVAISCNISMAHHWDPTRKTDGIAMPR